MHQIRTIIKTVWNLNLIDKTNEQMKKKKKDELI